MSTIHTDTAPFAEAIAEGLSAPRKYIPSKYFYDAAGDALFQKIMHLPEYYLTAAESEIFKTRSGDILDRAGLQNGVQLIELGAGDGIKTRLLLREMMRRGLDFTYYPIDISAHALRELETNLQTERHDGLRMESVEGEYFEALHAPRFEGGGQKFILFLGSSIGNFDRDDGTGFLQNVARTMQPGDLFLAGFDLKKDPALVLAAYNDEAGITRAFNMNLLLRMNRELGAEFDIGQFAHYPLYDPEPGAAKSYLVSKRRQTVYIRDLARSFEFGEGEVIFTEISRKYDLPYIETMASAGGLQIVESFFDSRHYFADVVMKK